MAQLRRSEFLALVGAGLALPARAQGDYPTRPIELVVPVAPGGGTDVMARSFAEAARPHAPQPFVVVNRPGASGAIGMQEVLNSRPDGYRVSVVIAELAILPFLGQIRFSADDFRMVARLNADPACIAVRSDAPWQNLEDFLAAARRQAEAIRVGNSGVGSIWHLAAAAMAARADVRFLDVPFPGSAPALLALLGNQLDAVCTSPGEASAHVQGGRMRVLGVMAESRQPGFDAVPTMRERGLDVSIGTWRGLGLRRDTPAPVVERLTAIARRAGEDAAFREALSRAGLGHALADGPAFEAAITRDRQLFGELVQRLRLG
ncbi:MAG: tripartite tricarboxylate transporter substrate binding protein [Acetobacteraceae bacterium]|nr:tripartite tricarboxylate transporter substrate binding protein [Acetobacteraceae bacterium]